jgi:hypothetical protein
MCQSSHDRASLPSGMCRRTARRSLHIPESNNLAETVMFSKCIREVPGSNIGRFINYPEVLRSISSLPSGSDGTVLLFLPFSAVYAC